MAWIALASYAGNQGKATALVLEQQLYDLEQLQQAGLSAAPAAYLSGGVEAVVKDGKNGEAWLIA